ncbi:MAG: hypothetical protein ACK52V_06435 [Betaproteobacteria bacterium]|jgi:hypothetical protein
MTVRTGISQVVQDQSANPPVKTNQLEKGGIVRTAQGYLAAANFPGGTVGQWYTFVRLPARARVLGIFLTGATTTTGAVRCGLYRPDGIAIDDDVFATNYAMSVEKDRADIMVTPTALERSQSLAEAYATAIGTAGATNDVEFDIALAIVTVLGSAQPHLLEVDYVLPE